MRFSLSLEQIESQDRRMTPRQSHDGGQISDRLLREVASYAEKDLLELPPLQETIDVEALDRVFESAGSGDGMTRLEFEYAECRIRISQDGSVDLTPVND